MSFRVARLLIIAVAPSVLSGCSRALTEGSPLSPSGLVPSAASVLSGSDTTPTLRTVVTTVNRSDRPAYVEYGACATRVLAYRSPEAGAPAVWDSNQRRSWTFGAPVACLMYLAATTVAPGDTLAPPEFRLEVPLMDILGDSLPDGHYYFKASVGLSNHASLADIPAGDAELAVARPPLASTRRSLIMQWTAAPASLGDGVVRAKATGTVVNANSALVTLDKNCPILIRVYRDRDRRDSAPRSGPADWSQAACTPATENKVLNRGETVTFETGVAVRDILGSALPAGRYYFAVLVKGDGMEMLLSGGELDLAR